MSPSVENLVHTWPLGLPRPRGRIGLPMRVRLMVVLIVVVVVILGIQLLFGGTGFAVLAPGLGDML